MMDSVAYRIVTEYPAQPYLFATISFVSCFRNVNLVAFSNFKKVYHEHQFKVLRFSYLTIWSLPPPLPFKDKVVKKNHSQFVKKSYFDFEKIVN